MEWVLFISRFILEVGSLQLLNALSVMLELSVYSLNWNNPILIKNGLWLHGLIVILGLILSLCGIFNNVFELGLLLIDGLKSLEWQLLWTQGWFLVGIAF